MRRVFRITEKQLNEMLNSDLMFSTDPTSEYCGSEISTTEPVGDNNFGDPMTGDDREKEMEPSKLSRMTTGRSGYVGPVVF